MSFKRGGVVCRKVSHHFKAWRQEVCFRDSILFR